MKIKRSRRPPLRASFVLCLSVFLVSAGTASAELAGSGITEPFRDATVGSRVLGTVARIAVVEGDFVKKGDPIVELDNSLETLEVSRRKLVAESSVELDAARRQLELKKSDYEATKKISGETKSVLQEELFAKEIDYLLAQADTERLAVAEQREEIEYRIAVAQLDERTIGAPFDGVVVKLFVEVGENCSPQQPLVRIADIRQVRLVLYAEAQSARRLKRGLAVTVRVDEAAAFSRRGTVDFISPVIDPSSGLREVKVLIDNADGRINPGTSGSLILD